MITLAIVILLIWLVSKYFSNILKWVVIACVAYCLVFGYSKVVNSFTKVHNLISAITK